MDFLYKKHPKGSYEHAKYKRTVDILITVFLFLLSLGLFFKIFIMGKNVEIDKEKIRKTIYDEIFEITLVG